MKRLDCFAFLLPFIVSACSSSAGPAASPNGGSAPATGGSSSGGSDASGGSKGVEGTDGPDPFTPIVCAPDAGRPSDAPKLESGVWKQIDASPKYWANGIVVDRCNASVLYSVGGTYPSDSQHGVFRSEDGGATWKQLVKLDSPGRIRVDSRDSKNMYVVDGVNGGTMGFWRTTDGGKTWEMPAGFIEASGRPEVQQRDAYDVAVNPEDFRHVLVTFHNPWAGWDRAAGVLESPDGGDTWVVHAPEPSWAGAYGYGVFFLSNPELGLGDSQTWLFGSQGDGYWKTKDGGETWTQVSKSSMTHGGAQLYYTKQGTIYLSSDDGVLKSADNGDTFTLITVPISGAAHLLSVFGDGTNLYAGGYGTPVYTATEQADTEWTEVSDQTFMAGPYEMTYDPKNAILYSANASAGLWALRR